MISLSSRGQISMDVMYSVGVMMVIFLILTGISFNRSREIADTDEFLEKRNQCFKVADYLSSVATGGDGTIAEVTLRYDTEVQATGTVIVGKKAGGSETGIDVVEVSCAFSANTTTTFLDKQKTYKIANVGSVITITLVS